MKAMIKHLVPKVRVLWWILVYTIIIGMVVYNFRINYFLGTFLFSWIPTIFLLTRFTQLFRTVLIWESLIGMSTLGVLIDFIGHKSGAWWASNIRWVFIFDVVPLEDLWRWFRFICFILCSYKFLQKDDFQKPLIRSSSFATLWAILILCLFFISLYSYNPKTLIIEYFYSWLLIIFLCGAVYLLLKFPKRKKLKFLLCIHISSIYWIQELFWISLGFWWFEMWNHLFYICSIPFEEFAIFPLATLVVIGLHESLVEN